ncbi:hypothetical protein [Streptomyces sp. NPDC051000]|uniref:hypothetical protein n=1 Tax=Streptomyces sp. NPDC051000 TaxID=3155520 RepID=UPI00340C2C44
MLQGLPHGVGRVRVSCSLRPRLARLRRRYGVTKESVLSKANTTWPHAEQISAGAFTGKATNDLMVRWSDGETTIYPGVDTAGFHGEIKIRDPKSPWLNAKVLTVGAFVGNKSAQDVLVRWTDGKLSLFPAVDAAGLHTEVKLVG